MNKRIAINLGLLMLAIVATTVGCSSIKSTMVDRDESNQCWQKHRHLRGIPITLKVPTHLKVYIFDIHFLEEVEIAGKTVIKTSEIDVPIRDFATEVVTTDKIFTVDFKRPGAGAYNLRLDMDDKQYFEKIQHDVTDETLKKVDALVKQVAPKGILATPAGGVLGEDDEIKFKQVKSVAAVGMFELDSPDLEQRVANFVNCHLNKSHDAFVVPPGANDLVNRVGISGSMTVEAPLCADEVGCQCEKCTHH